MPLKNADISSHSACSYRSAVWSRELIKISFKSCFKKILEFDLPGIAASGIASLDMNKNKSIPKHYWFEN